MSEEYEIILRKCRQLVRHTRKNWNYITPTEFYRLYLQRRLHSPYVLIDLRKKDAFDRFHVPKAVNIFWLDLFTDVNLKRLRKWTREGKKLFLICYVGHTSSQAMTMLNMLDIPTTSIKFGYGTTPMVGVPVAGWLQFNYPLVVR